ncbi:tripartite tricarboxylate transporter TctB family protein [Cohaesibacter celericrescens]|uniref:DUF1468 domain-containing protein n=1 Tax=Cohaesibacter celericrescens TaxID=2067669 RepID=A0A2N5XSX4_9HYPH|nr:tripartite tricarboxylate transporter TctB family protein [Cohaesibacter celericrescens]PLW77616.1 hypothetical protein C0081_09940 [Cohaesibacter celericrescens]
MNKALWRGVFTVAFFAVVTFILIPIYVPRPSFIPGFAPPPDMWPFTVSIIGIVLGCVAVIGAFLDPKRAVVETALEHDGAPIKIKLQRFLGLITLFGLFLLLVPYIGFLIGSILLIGTTILLTGERSYRIWAAAITVVGPILLLYIFNMALGTQFPKGLLTKPFGF